MKLLAPLFGVVLLGAAGLSCSSTFTPKACATDGDCGGGLVCSVDATAGAVCTTRAKAPLRIGMSAPFTGPNQDLGTEMKKGIQLAFDLQNANGGIHGRSLVLDFRDDQYQPDPAEANARALTDAQDIPGVAPVCKTTHDAPPSPPPVSNDALRRGPNAVLAFLGNVGTPTMVRTAPIAVETGTLFFGPFTGSAKMLRDGSAGACSKYIFNVRASYAQEARATVEYFLLNKVPDAQHVISFDQNDTYGQAGYDGLTAAWTALKGPIDPNAPIPRFRYTRNDETSVPAQVAATTAYLAKLLKSDNATHVVGVLMTDTYGAGTSYIQGIRTWQWTTDTDLPAADKTSRLQLIFSNVSFVGPNTLAQRLSALATATAPGGQAHSFTEKVFVSQVVPNYDSDSSDAVRDYQRGLTQESLTASFTSLEGYLAARVFLAGLEAHQGLFTPDALVGTFESLPPQALGFGASAGFSPTNHQYSQSVWGTAITPEGKFTNTYFWTQGSPISLFE